MHDNKTHITTDGGSEELIPSSNSGSFLIAMTPKAGGGGEGGVDRGGIISSCINLNISITNMYVYYWYLIYLIFVTIIITFVLVVLLEVGTLFLQTFLSGESWPWGQLPKAQPGKNGPSTWELWPYIVHYENIASAKTTPVLREAMQFLLEPRWKAVNMCPAEYADI